MQTGVDRIVENLGGSPEKNKTGVDKILEILENGGGGGSSLPEYDSGDAGKVLSVNSAGNGVEWKTPISGKCTLTETGLAESYNDLLLMLSKGYIPYYQDTAGNLWLCTACNIDEDGIMFRKNTDIPLNQYFFYEDSPDDPLLFD